MNGWPQPFTMFWSCQDGRDLWSSSKDRPIKKDNGHMKKNSTISADDFFSIFFFSRLRLNAQMVRGNSIRNLRCSLISCVCRPIKKTKCLHFLYRWSRNSGCRLLRIKRSSNSKHGPACKAWSPLYSSLCAYRLLPFACCFLDRSSSTTLRYQ